MSSLESNIPTLNYSRMKKSVIQKIKHTEQVACIVSTTGFGKTTLIRELANEDGLDYNVVSINCALLQEGDLYFPYLSTDTKRSPEVVKLKDKLFKDGYNSLTEDELKLLKDSASLPYEGKTLVEFLLHPSLAKIVTDYEINNKNSILFMDELGNLKVDVMSEVMNLILDKEVMGKSLPSGTKIVTAMNPSSNTKGYELTNYSTIEFTDAFKSRLTFIFLEVELEDWLNGFAYTFNKEKNRQTIHNDVINFLKSHIDFFKTDLENDGYKNELNTPNPRNWENVSDYIYLQEDNEYNDLDILESDIFGKVGGMVTFQFMKYYKDKPSYINIMELIDLSKGSNSLSTKLKDKITKMTSYTLNINVENIIQQVLRNPLYEDLIDVNSFIDILVELVLLLGDEGFSTITDIIFSEDNTKEFNKHNKLDMRFKANDDYIMKYVETHRKLI